MTIRGFFNRFDHFWNQDRGLSSLLAILCTLLFVFHPLSDIDTVGEVIINIFFTLLLISGVMSVMQNKVWMAILITFAVLVLVFSWIDIFSTDPTIQLIDSILNIFFYSLLAWLVLLNVFKEGPVTRHRIQGAIVVYLLVGLVMAFAYQAIYYADPENSFHFSTSLRGHFSPEPGFLYFSIVTLTTIGYGDITPVHPMAQSLVMIEGLTGQLYPVILIARLVSMHIVRKQ